LKVHIIDLKEKENGRKFLMVDEVLSEERVTMIVATEDGTMDFRMSFSDSFNPTPGGGTFQSTLKVGRNSVYFMWDVAVNSDPDYVKSVTKHSSSDSTVVSLQIDSEDDEKHAQKDTSESDEKKGKVVVIKEKIHSALDRDGDGELTLSDVKVGVVQAGQTIKKGAVKVGKTVKKGAKKTKEKVVAAKDKTHEYTDQKKAKKEAEAAEAEARAEEAEAAEADTRVAEAETRAAEAEARAAEAEADARVAEAEARTAKAEAKAKKAAEDVPLTKEEKKAAGLERVKANAAKIDFGTIGIATMSEKDDLQVVKGIGPFIEEKLNALGIYTFQQISKMSSDLEDQVNEAIEFFPGRVKRDQWVMQCKTILNDE
jgi:predicted flap endonuclease-1-like 5' DNA nuclease